MAKKTFLGGFTEALKKAWVETELESPAPAPESVEPEADIAAAARRGPVKPAIKHGLALKSTHAMVAPVFVTQAEKDALEAEAKQRNDEAVKRKASELVREAVWLPAMRLVPKSALKGRLQSSGRTGLGCVEDLVELGHCVGWLPGTTEPVFGREVSLRKAVKEMTCETAFHLLKHIALYPRPLAGDGMCPTVGGLPSQSTIDEKARRLVGPPVKLSAPEPAPVWPAGSRYRPSIRHSVGDGDDLVRSAWPGLSENRTERTPEEEQAERTRVEEFQRKQLAEAAAKDAEVKKERDRLEAIARETRERQDLEDAVAGIVAEQERSNAPHAGEW